MSGRVLTRLVPVVLVLAASLTACGGDDDADPPATELGEQEWEYFEGRGVERIPGLASNA